MSRNTSCNHGASLLLSAGSSSWEALLNFFLVTLEMFDFLSFVSNSCSWEAVFFICRILCKFASAYCSLQQGSGSTERKFSEWKNCMSLKMRCITNQKKVKAILAWLFWKILGHAYSICESQTYIQKTKDYFWAQKNWRKKCINRDNKISRQKVGKS